MLRTIAQSVELGHAPNTSKIVRRITRISPWPTHPVQRLVGVIGSVLYHEC